MGCFVLLPVVLSEFIVVVDGCCLFFILILVVVWGLGLA